MSTEWNVIVFDKPNTDRTKVRPAHVAAIPATVNAGIVKSVGALYQDTAKTKFAGSTFHLMADSKEQILDFLSKDVYAKEGIWDLKSVIAHPVGIACRLAKPMDGVHVN